MTAVISKRLEGKTILITGASSGIGRSTAFEFARTCPLNLKLILTARRIDSLKQIAAEITKAGAGVKVLPVQLDVSNADEVRAFVGNLPAEFKEADVLVNNASVFPRGISISRGRGDGGDITEIKQLTSLANTGVWSEA